MINHTLFRLNETDKHQHIMVSFMIMLISLFFLTIISSLVFTSAIGIAKENWDKYYGNEFCWYDMLANSLGIVLAIVLYKIIN